MTPKQRKIQRKRRVIEYIEQIGRNRTSRTSRKRRFLLPTPRAAEAGGIVAILSPSPGRNCQ
jgi:hypothetical protein